MQGARIVSSVCLIRTLTRVGLAAAVLMGLFFGTAPAFAKIKVGIVFDKGGKDDKSFNASAFRGLKEAEEKLKIDTKWVEVGDDNSFAPALKAFARRDFDLIIGVGFAQADAIKKIAQEFPKKHFALVDAQVELPNVRSLMFAEHEGAFLVGAAAALASKTGKVGFVGGMDIPLIRRFEHAYRAGAQFVNPKAMVLANFVGVTGEAWNNPAKAKELALTQSAAGADVVFAAAGASGNGVFDAAEERKFFVIGCDSNQNWIKPGLVLTSMLKNVDAAVFKTIEDKLSGKFLGGTMSYALADGGVGYALDEHNQKILTSQMRQQLDELKARIVAGKIDIPDYYKKAKK